MSGYDAELARYNEAMRRAWAIQPRDRVLDIGCGAGWTTRQAALMAPDGSVLGVDVSAPAIERARAIARDEGLGNVTFEHADAQTYAFAPRSFDVAISRFGTMFFDDPAVAFGNIGSALRASGRLVMLVWQAHDRNEWDVAVQEALASPAPLAPDGLDPFSLADPAAVQNVLGAAGFADISFTDVREPIYFGASVAAALEWVRGFTCTSDYLERLDPTSAARAVSRLREMLEAHLTDEGVRFKSSAWIVTARA